MAKPMGERMAVLETEVKQISKDVAEVRQHQTENHVALASSIDLLIEKVDGKFSDHEARIRIVEETTEPFTKFKKRLWTIIIVSMLSVSTVALVWAEIRRLN